MDNKTKGIIGDYINSLSENHTQTPNMGKDDLILQLPFSLDSESDKIDDDNEEFYSDCNMIEYD